MHEGEQPLHKCSTHWIGVREMYKKLPYSFSGFSLQGMWFSSRSIVQFCIIIVPCDMSFILVLDLEIAIVYK